MENKQQEVQMISVPAVLFQNLYNYFIKNNQEVLEISNQAGNYLYQVQQAEAQAKAEAEAEAKKAEVVDVEAETEK